MGSCMQLHGQYRILIFYCALLLLSFALTGCLPSASEGPPRFIPVADETTVIRETIGYADLASTSFNYRNAYVTARMYATDLHTPSMKLPLPMKDKTLTL
jgi:hypothetical protein